MTENFSPKALVISFVFEIVNWTNLVFKVIVEITGLP